MKLQHFLLLCGFTLTSAITVQAQAQVQHTQTSGNMSATNNQDVVKAPVMRLYQALNTIQKSAGNSLVQNEAILNQALDNSYDFPAIVGKTVGYRYNSFTPQEKTAVLEAFKKYTIARYLSSFANEKDTQFKISPDVKTGTTGNKQIVSTTIGSGNDTTPINYIVQNTPQGWRIVDVLLNGNISQTAVQHGDFSSTLAKGGSQALVEMLNKKTQSFNRK
ncbi:Periplasmic subunit MlaC of the ABC-type intermembrane phospholipid transporter Mla (MlaC) (PDB:2QGU) (PUBMED:19383799) [Commensalibacter communis]|uniref:ABC transporter substrate-binding protein n=1 Tax=Commensalibacter communis TaxID=2972786 RepID=UPI0022FF9CC7|nr:ABC transporter substrate-binding protein [Commensalibacter communis]CAI3923283.1 Periplasmic subunit MlaC of the ABC-type intermembrane phospholipid transporter Mla (MlaC) (PDB:2QGU) (PUBMED:19383799) [Commensalibacter communis]CAI3936134.1 Periplasmic subunit MlaC of the ABC-type intermembrane phospholipid transporter Mla (MlaC) (PDB:2QGU) (PUBMED:19383799) [Commensalibacter communis]